MGASAGPSLAGIGRGGDSNLVLEMDAHDAKSYPGEPTSNLYGIVGQYAQNNGNHTGTIVTGQPLNFPVPLAPPLYSYYKIVATGAWSSESNRCLQWPGTIGYAVSTSYHMSFWARTDNPGSGIMYSFYFGGGGRNYATLTSEWQLFSCQSTTQATYRPVEIVSTESGGQTYYVAAIQVEDKTYATPYVQYEARPATTNLMIHGNVGTGQSFSDSSPSKHTITANGNTTHSAAQSKFSGGSIYFDGTGDSLTATSTDFAVGSGEFTIDAWLYKTASTDYETLFDTYSAGGTDGFLCGLWTNSTISFYSEGGIGWKTATGSTQVALNTWTHLAWVRDGNTLRMFLNGVQQASYTFGADNLDSSSLIIGGRSTAQYITGYMDEMRITKGTALWTSNFTPPTRRNLSAPVVDRSGNDNGGNFATTDMTDVSTYRVGEVIRPIASATWDFDGTDDAISIKTDAFDLKCFTVAIKQGGIHAGPFPAVPGQVNVGMNIGGNGFNGIIMGSWTGTMDDETLSLWGYASTNPSGSGATYIKDVIEVGWHIFTFNWNGSDYDIWVDGTKRITFARGGGSGHSGLLSGVTAIYPGRSLGWSTNYFEGNIGFFRAYDKSLSDQQIIENFHAKRNSLNIANWGNRDIVQNGLDLWLDAGVAASYPESGSTWYDLTANNYNGTIANATYDVYGDGSLSFDGSGDTVDVGPISTGGEHSSCTISIWMNKAAQVSTHGNLYDCNYGITDYNKGPRMEVDAAGSIVRVYMGTDGGSYTSISFGSLSNSVWYNLVLTVTPNGSNMDLKSYVDGVLYTSSTPTGTTWDGDVGDLYLGVGFTAGRHFTGKIAAFELYNRVLSASEIEQNFIVQRQRFGK